MNRFSRKTETRIVETGKSYHAYQAWPAFFQVWLFFLHEVTIQDIICSVCVDHSLVRVTGVLSVASTRLLMSWRKWVPYLCSEATTSVKVDTCVLGVSHLTDGVPQLFSISSLVFLEHCTDGSLSGARTGMTVFHWLFYLLRPANSKPVLNTWYILLLKGN